MVAVPVGISDRSLCSFIPVVGGHTSSWSSSAPGAIPLFELTIYALPEILLATDLQRDEQVALRNTTQVCRFNRHTSATRRDGGQSLASNGSQYGPMRLQLGSVTNTRF